MIKQAGSFVPVYLADTINGASGIIFKGTDRFIHNFHHPTGGGAVPVGQNTFVGVNAGNFTMGSTATQTYEASYNVFVGQNAGQANTTGYQNVFVGLNAGQANTTGYQNVFVGQGAGYSNTTGNYNVFVGQSAGYYETGSNTLFIDNAARASEADGRIKALVYGTFAAATANQNLRINGNVQLGSAAGAEVTTIDGTGFGAGVASVRLNGLTTAATNNLVGTLTNAPVTGNPTFWIPINVAGAVKYIPAW